MADWAYDADYVRVQIAQAGAGAVIPGKKNRVVPVEHDAEKRLFTKNETGLSAPSTA